jgi:hypothetical protein
MKRKHFALLSSALMMVISYSLALAQEVCVDKSLFVNISSERVRAVQVGLIVAMANASPEEQGGQGAAIQLFFADAAAPYVIDTEKLSRAQSSKLNGYLKKEFRYTLSDVQRLQTQDAVFNAEGQLLEPPGILWLHYVFGAEIYACNVCVEETLAAIGIDVEAEGFSLSAYMIPEATVMTPNKFGVLYDREVDSCSTSAAVISY